MFVALLGVVQQALTADALGQKTETAEKTVSYPRSEYRCRRLLDTFGVIDVGVATGAGQGAGMDWARVLAYVTGTVDQELLARNEYLAAENRILRASCKAG